MGTFTFAILNNIKEVFFANASRTWSTLAVEICGILGPAGLVLLPVCMWRRRPKKRTFQIFILWFALLVACCLFCDFQYREDCEFSSATPGCCLYPGLSDWNHADEREGRCNFDARCQ